MKFGNKYQSHEEALQCVVYAIKNAVNIAAEQQTLQIVDCGALTFLCECLYSHCYDTTDEGTKCLEMAVTGIFDTLDNVNQKDSALWLRIRDTTTNSCDMQKVLSVLKGHRGEKVREGAVAVLSEIGEC